MDIPVDRPLQPAMTGLPFERIALLLQGGGALGSYQAGVYQALSERGIEPTWIAGISIGAINSAIIAGNPRDRRVERLREFWETVTASPSHALHRALMPNLRSDFLRGIRNQVSAMRALLVGVPGFYEPRPVPPTVLPSTSWYDPSALVGTLERLVDFDRLNDGRMRFSVGAVDVETGNFAYFDSENDVIGVPHIMASGALPPAFPPVEIGGRHYWDGGLVSNTPLDWVLEQHHGLDTLAFQVDLWSARGPVPTDLAEVAVRQKEVQFSSRTRASTDSFRKVQKRRAAFKALMEKLPPELASTEEARLLAEDADPSVYNIVHLIYRSPAWDDQAMDYEFSRSTMEAHWRAGHQDAVRTLTHPEVLQRPGDVEAVQVFDYCTREHRQGR